MDCAHEEQKGCPHGFWGKLPHPFFAMAPLADVTDAAFRRIIARYSAHGTPHGGPHVFYTEFVSCDGLCSPGRDALLPDLAYTESERPIVAQLFGGTPEHFSECARLAAQLGFDGIDINMGCPDRSVERQGAGAALMNDPPRARAIIRAIREGVRAAGSNIPVSVKTRIGHAHDDLPRWLPELLAESPAAVTIHARTRNELSLVPARWEHVAEAVAIARDFAKREGKPRTLIVGNGDAADIADARRKAAESGADGVMLGRAIFGNPWLFSNSAPAEHDGKIGAGAYIPTVREKLSVMLEHTRLFEKLLGDTKSFAIMKKHYKSYVNGFPGARELRIELFAASDAREVANITERFLAAHAHE